MPVFHRHNTRAAKITPQDVLSLREDYAAGMTQRELCQKYGLSIGQVGRITRGEAWRGFATVAPPAEIQDRAIQSQQRLKAMLDTDPVQTPGLDKLNKMAEKVLKPERDIDAFLDTEAAAKYLQEESTDESQNDSTDDKGTTRGGPESPDNEGTGEPH